MSLYLAIDLGGTKTAVSVADASGAILAGDRIPTEAETDPAVWRTRLDALIRETLRKAGVTLPQITRVGLAGADIDFPGAIRVLVREGVPVARALRMATAAPARGELPPRKGFVDAPTFDDEAVKRAIDAGEAPRADRVRVIAVPDPMPGGSEETDSVR